MTTVTVAICTHNRAQDVSRCCYVLVPQAREMGFPVVIVDSASDPVNAAELSRLAAEYGTQYLRLETAGLSLARNLAHEHAASEWIAYLDDDAIPQPDWAKSLLVTLSVLQPEVAVVGGKIIPQWPSGLKTDHITVRWKLLLSCVDAAGWGLVSEGYNICGANLVVRRAALDRAGRFPITLGRNGMRLIGGEESSLIERLSQLGFSAVYNDAFSVWHCIPPERLKLKWVARRAFWEGVSRIAIFSELGRPLPASLGKLKLLMSVPVLFALSLISSNPDHAIRFHMALGSLLGQTRSGA